MDKSYKLYKKALIEYQNSNINKALRLCDKSISLDIKCAAALNLKGLLYYLLGSLNNAKALWKLNCNMNKDSVSKKYLESTQEDESKGDKYYKALGFIKEVKINEAIILLEQCEESDFNCINVNNSLARCYLKKGEYIKADKCINKVLSIDRKNPEAIKNKKVLLSCGINR